MKPIFLMVVGGISFTYLVVLAAYYSDRTIVINDLKLKSRPLISVYDNESVRRIARERLATITVELPPRPEFSLEEIEASRRIVEGCLAKCFDGLKRPSVK